jgi:hypothetical protein
MKKDNPRRSLMPAVLETGKPTLYVFRDDGTGRQDGTYVKKYDHQPTVEELNADLPAGLYVLLQSERGNMKRKRIIIEGTPGAAEATAPPRRDALQILERAVEMKALASALRDDVDPLEQLARVKSILGGSGDIGLFREGLSLGRDLDGDEDDEISPELGLARDLVDRLAPAPSGAGRQWKEIAITLARRTARLEQLITGIVARLDRLAAEPKGADEMPGRVTMSDAEMHTQITRFVQALAANLPQGPESLSLLLNMQNAETSGRLKTALKRATSIEKELTITRILAERVDLIDTYRETIENFLKD